MKRMGLSDVKSLEDMSATSTVSALRERSENDIGDKKDMVWLAIDIELTDMRPMNTDPFPDLRMIFKRSDS